METRTADGRHRVVITGLGLLTPVGNDVESSWRALLEGTSGAAPITQFDATPDFDVRFAAEVKDFDPSVCMDRKEAKRMDRFAQLAMAASRAPLCVSSIGVITSAKNLLAFLMIGRKLSGEAPEPVIVCRACS